MRLHSTPESVERGEVSLLAILETLVAVSLVFYLSAHLNTLKWLAVAMCVAPLLLLRTDESVDLGRRIFDRIMDITMPTTTSWAALSGEKLLSKKVVLFALGIAPEFVNAVGLLSGALFTRISATVLTAISHPFVTIRTIPENWGTITAVTDSFVPPEIVPGHYRSHFKVVITSVRKDTSNRLWFEILLAPLVLGGLFIFFLPALLYRWSLKATSIIYAPLVFIVHTTFRNVKNLRTKLELIKRSDLSRIGALYALFFIVAFLVKLILMLKLPGFAAWWNTNPVGEFLALYIAPSEIPKWQLASFTNSLLALGLLFFARHTLLRFELGEPVNETAIQRLLGLTTGLRTVLTLYTILCTIYITLNTARGLPWPKIGENWLPWG